MLDSLMPQPASIQKPNFDIVARNDSFCRLMGVDFATIAEEDRNCIYLYLTCEARRSRIEKSRCVADFCFLFFARRWLSIAVRQSGKISWRAFFRRFSGVRSAMAPAL